MEWPYIVPLPVDKDKRVELLKEVFGSDVSLKILKTCLREGEVEQRFLIEKLKDFKDKSELSHRLAIKLDEDIDTRNKFEIPNYIQDAIKWVVKGE